MLKLFICRRVHLHKKSHIPDFLNELGIEILAYLFMKAIFQL
jgi:hypothetical protein